MLEFFQRIDDQLVIFFSSFGHATWLNTFFVFFTDLHKKPWAIVCFLTLLCYFGFRKIRWQFWRPLLAMAIAIAASDLVSYRVLKANVTRLRPAAVLSQVTPLANATGNSFPSNHAANCFAAAVILSLMFPSQTFWFYLFAALVGFSRVYLGVHYVSDVLAGAIVGILVGNLASLILRDKTMPSTRNTE